jgi:hypothetical protein
LRRREERLVRLGAVFVLLAVVLPSVTYMGHWPIAGVHAHNDEAAPHTHSAPNSDEHASHCHVGPAKCAGSQAMVGSIWVGEDAGLLTLDAPHRRMETQHEARAADGVSVRLLQPPQPLV